MTRTPLFTTRLDTVSSNLMYLGKAAVGSSESDAVWKIQKIETVGSVLSIKHVNGNTDVDSVWNDRASYTYS